MAAPTADGMQGQLEALYVQAWPRLASIRAYGPTLSTPCLAAVHPDYLAATVKLVVVGKEPNGWVDWDALGGLPAEAAIAHLMEAYRSFGQGRGYRGAGSFWTPVRELYNRLNPGGPTQGFMALNASVVDDGGRRPDDAVLDLQAETGLLAAQLKALSPEVVVFHTGPEYEPWLPKLIPGIRIDGDMLLGRAQWEDSPRLAFRTFHPNRLNRLSKRGEVYDSIVEAARAIHRN